VTDRRTDEFTIAMLIADRLTRCGAVKML